MGWMESGYSQASITKDQLARAMTGGTRAGTFGDIVVVRPKENRLVC